MAFKKILFWDKSTELWRKKFPKKKKLWRCSSKRDRWLRWGGASAWDQVYKQSGIGGTLAISDIGQSGFWIGGGGDTASLYQDGGGCWNVHLDENLKNAIHRRNWGVKFTLFDKVGFSLSVRLCCGWHVLECHRHHWNFLFHFLWRDFVRFKFWMDRC